MNANKESHAECMWESFASAGNIYREYKWNEEQNQHLGKYIPKNIFARKSDLKRGNGRERLFVYFIFFAWCNVYLFYVWIILVV